MLEARTAAGGVTATDQYVWDLSYVDSPVVCYHDATSNGSYSDTGDSILYYTSDANHNVTAAINASDGSLAARYVYAPYGQPTAYSGTWTNAAAPTSDGPLYCGYWFDAETGNYLARNREFITVVSTWDVRDPLGYAAGDDNLYRYLGNRPTNATDASGMVWSWLSGWFGSDEPVAEATGTRAADAWRDGGWSLAAYQESEPAWQRQVLPDYDAGMKSLIQAGDIANSFFSSAQRAANNAAIAAVNVGSGVKELANRVRDDVCVGVDAAFSWAGVPFGKDWSLGVQEWSQAGRNNQPDNPKFWQNAFEDFWRTELAGLSFGTSEYVPAISDYSQTGDADALQQRMFTVAGGTLAGIAGGETWEAWRGWGSPSASAAAAEESAPSRIMVGAGETLPTGPGRIMLDLPVTRQPNSFNCVPSSVDMLLDHYAPAGSRRTLRALLTV